MRSPRPHPGMAGPSRWPGAQRRCPPAQAPAARCGSMGLLLGVVLFGLLAAAPRPADADISRFDLGARIFTNHLYANDDSQGTLWLGNPFWPDQIAGSNGVSSELELTVTGRVSEYVSAGARIASRYGERWQDYWESGNRMYGDVENTSGDSAGLNRAAYLKLRGPWIQLNPGLRFVDQVRIGASDLGMFNAWTIGKLRYIDRDNGKGYFAQGALGKERSLLWTAAAIALPKLWVGPWWSTGLGDPELQNPFWSRDWAYATNLQWRLREGTTMRLVASTTRDLESDIADPDALGSKNPTCKDALGHPIPGCQSDHAVDFVLRYASVNATFEVEQDVGDTVRAEALVAVSSQRLDQDRTANGVALNQGVSPVAFKDSDDVALRVRVTAADPWQNGLTLQGEYFSIGAEYNAIFGARREADVLLTDGFLGGGQLPTLNLANEFIDFNEAWVESCIGWHGGTGLLQWENEGGDLKLGAEYTFLSYHTNRQNRNVDDVFPTFLHSDGYTDTMLYDYANTRDRGRDPRSVYRRDQWRRTSIGVLRGRKTFELGNGLSLDWKIKYIHDEDYRSTTTVDDDYLGKILHARLQIDMPVASGVNLAVGTTVDRWFEENRRGTLELGYGDDQTERETGYLTASYQYGGFRAGYKVEYVHKLQRREREDEARWSVWRSKATFEVAW